MIIETPPSLQSIANKKYLSELHEAADHVFTAKEQDELSNWGFLTRGAALARAADGKRIFRVSGREAASGLDSGDTFFFFFGKSVAEVAKKLRALQDN